MVLAVGGGLVGLGLAWAALRVLSTQHPTGLPRLAEVSLDPSVLAVSAGLSVLVGLVFGIAPAARFSRPTLVAALRDGSGATAGATRHLLRRGLMIVQIAFSLVLVIGAVLLVRSLIALNQATGFRPQDDLPVARSL